ncbi:hypothetical protein [Kordiimonas sp.]|uniref:hypothetical protein n=1 Tax=Kordiimonas sp. TaxID=1970157 RepID=UPI003A8EB182
MKKNAKQYTVRFSTSMLGYVVTLLAVNTYLADKVDTFAKWQLVALALLPMIPVFFLLWAVVSFVRSWDEMQQRMYMEATIISFVLVGMGTFSYGFLEGVGFPPLGTSWILPMLIGVQGIAQAYTWRKFK